MTSDKYPLYGLAIVAGAAMAVWAGLSPSLLIFLVVCPLMMFFMMRGMQRGHGSHDAHSSHNANDPADYDIRRSARTSKLATLDGSHERIDES